MKQKSLFLILCVLFILIIFNCFLSMNREEFTPGIRSFYRPYERNIRNSYNRFYNNLNHRSNMFFRQIGII